MQDTQYWLVQRRTWQHSRVCLVVLGQRFIKDGYAQDVPCGITCGKRREKQTGSVWICEFEKSLYFNSFNSSELLVFTLVAHPKFIGIKSIVGFSGI